MVLIKFIPLILLLVPSRGEDELIAVSALIRHGSRIPISFYPTDPYKNYSWPFVLGDLTDRGVKQMYEAGQWLRKKYKNFLSEKYVPKEIYAHSVEFDRCLMTAEATLAGLYPPIGDEIWNSKLLWQPIPIHASPNSQDIITNMLNPCPGKLKAVASVMMHSPEIVKFMKLYGPLLRYISAMAGENITVPGLYPFFDTLFCEKDLGLELPEWAEKVYPYIEPAIVTYTKMNSQTNIERKLQIGPLVTRIVEQFEHAISGQEFGTTKTIYRKFMAYFSTEWMLYDFTYGLGLKGIGIPNYGAMYLIELRKNDTSYYVNMVYRDSATPGTKPHHWHFKGDNSNVQFDAFKEIVKPLQINSTEWVKLCDKFTGENATVVLGVPMS